MSSMVTVSALEVLLQNTVFWFHTSPSKRKIPSVTVDGAAAMLPSQPPELKKPLPSSVTPPPFRHIAGTRHSNAGHSEKHHPTSKTSQYLFHVFLQISKFRVKTGGPSIFAISTPVF
jgi:hypothetical protein